MMTSPTLDQLMAAHPERGLFAQVIPVTPVECMSQATGLFEDHPPGRLLLGCHWNGRSRLSSTIVDRKRGDGFPLELRSGFYTTTN